MNIESYFSVIINHNLATVSRLTKSDNKHLWNVKEGVKLDTLSSLNIQHVTTIAKNKLQLSEYLDCKFRILHDDTIERMANDLWLFSIKHPIYCEDEYTALIIDSSITEWDETNVASSSFLSLVCNYYNIFNNTRHMRQVARPNTIFR